MGEREGREARLNPGGLEERAQRSRLLARFANFVYKKYAWIEVPIKTFQHFLLIHMCIHKLHLAIPTNSLWNLWNLGFLFLGPSYFFLRGRRREGQSSEEQQNRCSVLSRFGKGGGEGQFDFNWCTKVSEKKIKNLVRYFTIVFGVYILYVFHYAWKEPISGRIFCAILIPFSFSFKVLFLVPSVQ